MRLCALFACVALAACAHPSGAPLAGRIWDARAERFVSEDELLERAARARHVLLGETHDNAEHHRLQLRLLEALAARGETRVLAMEQFDSDQQAALDAAAAAGASAEALADAAHLDRQGWNWPFYRPLVEFALARGWPLVAANVSRAEARAIVGDPARSGLPPPPPVLVRSLEQDIVSGHCGKAPEPRRLAGMVEAQRARDARMAQALSGPRWSGSVLIAGIGHVRRDRGVPLYLATSELVAIALVEVADGKSAPRDYFDGFAGPTSFDYLWFTARAQREDPCRTFGL